MTIPESAIEAAVVAVAKNYGSSGTPTNTVLWNRLVADVRTCLEAAKPFMHRVVQDGDGLLPGTVVQDNTGDVLKLVDNGEWWATDDDGRSGYVEYPATVLVEGENRQW